METEEYIQPQKTGYTLYSKSGCPNCTKVKHLLKSVEPANLIVDCDDYLIENKQDFLQFIESLAGKEWKTFPMIFHNGQFVGGYQETIVYYEKQNAFDSLDC